MDQYQGSSPCRLKGDNQSMAGTGQLQSSEDILQRVSIVLQVLQTARQAGGHAAVAHGNPDTYIKGGATIVPSPVS